MGLQNSIQNPFRTTPYILIYVKPCYVPVELEHRAFWVIKALNYDLLRVGGKRLLDIKELDEIRLDAYESLRLYKEKTKWWHDKGLIRRNFEVGQMV